jgi:conjugal transfer ATP-binding protein TraC
VTGSTRPTRPARGALERPSVERSIPWREKRLITQLPFWDLEDGVLETRNRVLEVGLKLILPDSDFISDEGLYDLSDTYAHVLRALTPQGERARMITEVVTARKETSPLPAYLEGCTTELPLLRDLALSRHAALEAAFYSGAVRETNTYLCVTVSDFKAPGLQPFFEDEWPAVRDRALEVRSRLEHALHSVGVGVEPMDSQDIFALIWRYLNPGLHPAPAPRFKPLGSRVLKGLSRKAVQNFPELAVDTLRAQLLSSEVDNENPAFLRVGSKFLASLSMTGLPDQTLFSRIDRVFPPSGAFYLVTDVQHPRQAKAQRTLINQAKWALGFGQGMTGRARAKQQEGAVEEMQAEEKHIMKVGLTCLVLADDKHELQTLKRDVLGELQMLSGMRVAADGFDAFEQFMACLPFSARASRHQRTTFDDTAKNLMPTRAAWRGSRNPVSVFGNRHGGLVPFDALDERASGKHMIILGGTRTGKSFGAQAVMMDFLKRGDYLCVLDRGNSWDGLVQAAGGSVTTIDPGASSLNPFDLEPGELTPSPSSAGVMAGIVAEMLGESTPDERSLIPHAIAQAFEMSHHQSGGVTHTNPVLLSSVVRRLENLNRIGDSNLLEPERQIARALARRLQGWIGETPLGSFVDRPSTVDASSPVMSFETLRLKDNPQLQSVTMMMLSNLLLRWVTRDVRQRKRIVVEELQAMMDSPAAVETTAMLFSTAAKYNTAMTVINQGAQVFDHPSTAGILENANFYLLFRMTDDRDRRILQERLGLSNRMLETISTLTSVPGVYSEALVIIRRDDSLLEGGVVRIQTSPLEYWTYTSSSDDKARREDAIRVHGGDQRAALWALASDWKVIGG